MIIPDQFVYLIASFSMAPIWVYLYWSRRDLRKEILVMSMLIGVMSVVTSYYWWTLDWWRPLTITGTRVGIEDFITGFVSGGIMAAIYEVVFRRGLYRRRPEQHYPGATSIGLLLILLMTFLLSYGTTTFWAATISMLVAATIMMCFRPDLFLSGLISGALILLISMPVYYLIMFISPHWIDQTYLWQTLSQIRITGIPIEELVFWFLAGLVFGPFYEYWKHEQLRRLPA